MKIIKIDNSNIDILNLFIKDLGKSKDTFRYFNSRKIDVIKNHKCTLILLDTNKNRPVGYGHIDFEEGFFWLGIAIIPANKGKGYGKLIMNYLINYSKEVKINKIYLTVDKINIAAISLYEKFEFLIESETESNFKMYKEIIE